MTLWLHPENRPGEAVCIEASVFVIGRAGDCDWVLAGAGVSRRHAVIRRLHAVHLVEDVSRNGTRLNDKVLARGEPVPLVEGDRLGIDGLDFIVVDRMPDARRPETSFLAAGDTPPACKSDPFDGLPASIPDMSGATGRSWVPPEPTPRDALAMARELFDALLADLEPARFDREVRARFGRSTREAAWGRYHRHFRRIQVDPEAYFSQLIDASASTRTIR